MEFSNYEVFYSNYAVYSIIMSTAFLLAILSGMIYYYSRILYEILHRGAKLSKEIL